jgi:threonine synthase
MWRWHELLPVLSEQNLVSLGEGDTPILPIHKIGSKLGMDQLFIKDEGRNPTHSFKARGLAAAVSRAKELGLEKLIIPTAGNAGAALATYAARSGLKACIIMPSDTPRENIQQCRMSGAEVILIDGLINDAGALARQKSQSENWFDVSTFKEPYRLEGKKVMGYEIAEQFDWQLPDVIIYPTGGGTGLVGIWKAFQELKTLGWLENDKFPRMIAVQSAGCAPVVKAWNDGSDHCELWENAQTIAAGLRVPKPFADRLILQTIQSSQGTAISVTDAEITQAQKELATLEGIFACPEGAAPLAGLKSLLNAKLVEKNEKVLLLVTGSGLTNMQIT